MREHNLLPQNINDYCIQCSSKETDLARGIFESTKDLPNSHMLIERIIGNLLAIFVSMTKTQNILEIGTFTGYSAAMMVSSIKTGRITTLEENVNYYDLSINNLYTVIKENKIQVINEEGIKWLKKYAGELFDIIFIDARKESFFNEIELLYNNLTLYGLLIVDNSLARGTVLNPVAEWQILTNNFNDIMCKDPRFRTVLLPIRDGLLISQKVS
jgi:caffeoyl-CoA O-methyltransferase